MKNISNLSHNDLLKKFSVVISREREVIVDVIVHLAEIAKRKLYAKEGYSNIYAYLQKTFHYSGSAAFRRMQVVKLSARFPRVLRYLSQGRLNLTSVCLIEPHVTFSNGKRIIEQVLGKTKQEIEVFLADTFQVKPKQMQDKMRHLPVIKKRVPVMEEKIALHSAAKNSVKNNHIEKLDSPPSKEKVRYQTVEIRRVKVEFVVDEKVAKKIERAKEVLRHIFPKGKLEDVIGQALEDMLEKRDPERKLKRAEKKGPKGTVKSVKVHDEKKRYIPAQLKREVWKRDSGTCTFVGSGGERCPEKNAIEFDHVRPWALNGNSTKDNLRLLCRSHNQYRAQKTFGAWG